MKIERFLILLGAAVSLASAASAEIAPQSRDPLATGTAMAIRPAIDLSRPSVAPALSYARRDGAAMTGFPRTAISHRFEPDGLTGSVGYLCGIKPFAPDYYGVGAGPASGFDRGLTFLGLKLDYAFR